MKTIKTFVCLFFALISANSFGSVSFSYSYRFSPIYLQKLHDGLVEAQKRNPDLQDLIASVPLFDGSKKPPLQAVCFPHTPSAEGKGCSVAAVQDPPPAQGQLSVTIRKPVEMAILQSKLNEILSAIRSNNPNTTQGHLNFGNVLFSPGDDTKGSSDYFCAAEGQIGEMTWQCYFSVREQL